MRTPCAKTAHLGLCAGGLRRGGVGECPHRIMGVNRCGRAHPQLNACFPTFCIVFARAATARTGRPALLGDRRRGEFSARGVRAAPPHVGGRRGGPLGWPASVRVHGRQLALEEGPVLLVASKSTGRVSSKLIARFPLSFSSAIFHENPWRRWHVQKPRGRQCVGEVRAAPPSLGGQHGGPHRWPASVPAHGRRLA